MYNAQTKVSLFSGPITNTKPKQALSLFEVYQIVIGERGHLKSLTQTMRGISDPDERKKFKSEKLPFVLFGGEFSQRNRGGLTKSSNLIGVDFDHIGGEAQIEEYKKTLSEDRDLDPILLFRSPSGDGLKVVVNIRQEIVGDDEFKTSFKSLRNFIEQRYPDLRPQKTEDGKDIGFDIQVKDISRACFLCYDDKAIFREAGQGFDVDKWKPVEAPKPQVPQRPLSPVGGYRFGTEPSDLERAIVAVEDIERSGISLTDSREEWRNVGFELSTLGEDGRDLFHRLSSMSANYDPDGTDKFFTEALTRKYNGKKRELESLFDNAQDRGVQMRPSNVYLREAQKRVKTGSQAVNPHGNPSQAYEAPKQAQNRPQGPTPEEIEKQRQEFERKSRSLLEPTTEQAVIERESALPESLITGYQVKDEDGVPQALPLLSGKLTAIAGATGHGKTLFLMNLLLNVAKRYPEKRFILFTYEENSDTIIEYLLNIYLNDLNLMKAGESKKNRVLLKEYFRGQGTSDFGPQSVGDFNVRRDLFFRQYIENGRILIKYIDSDSTELCRFIDFLSDPQNNIGGVFVDYFQCINPDPEKRFPTRQEALKSICFELKDIANKTGLPVVLACQFNQQVLSPTDVLLNYIGEAGDISRIVSECWGLWQMGKDIGRSLSTKEEQRVRALEYRSEQIKSDDPFLKGMYLRVLKSRIVETGAEEMFRFRGLTGKIYPNDERETNILLDDWNRPQPTLDLSQDDDDLPM